MKRIIILSTLTILLMSNTKEKNVTIYQPIVETIEQLEKEFDKIPDERKEALNELAAFIKSKIEKNEKTELIFICTHNSRRSHIAQIWAQTAAAYYNVPNIISYSGGTEATAFNPRAVVAMQKVGFKINKTTNSTNPIYEVRYADDATAIKAFSKKYDEGGNPKKDFGAIMTCSHADENCPIVQGASMRIATPYGDPKEFDGTLQEAAKYSERVQQIATELLYAFSKVKN